MQDNYIRKRTKGKHLTLCERGKIEAYKKIGYTNKRIAEEIGVCTKTIQRELKRGEVELLNSDLSKRKEYSSDYAHIKYINKQSNKKGKLKIGSNIKLAKEIEHKIVVEKYSPYGAIEKLRDIYDINFSLKTLYNYIHQGLFLKLNESHLPYKKKYKRKYIKDKHIRKNGGTSIEERSEDINKRTTLGHWEMDTVVWKRGTKACLLVLTERVTRKEIIIKLRDKTSKSVINALKELKKRYKKTFLKRFKSITTDNGCEFMDAKSVEDMGVQYFYAHSYCSYERGSNENNNKYIRRFIKKGDDITKFTKKFIKNIETYINEYPRKIFNGKSANEVYKLLYV